MCISFLVPVNIRPARPRPETRSRFIVFTLYTKHIHDMYRSEHDRSERSRSDMYDQNVKTNVQNWFTAYNLPRLIKTLGVKNIRCGRFFCSTSIDGQTFRTDGLSLRRDRDPKGYGYNVTHSVRPRPLSKFQVNGKQLQHSNPVFGKMIESTLQVHAEAPQHRALRVARLPRKGAIFVNPVVLFISCKRGLPEWAASRWTS